MEPEKASFPRQSWMLGDVIYCGDSNGTLYALANRDGSIKWKFAPGDFDIDINIPAVTEDAVYIGGFGSYLYALNKADGVLRWKFASGSSRAPPVAVDGIVYFGSDDGYLYAVNA